MTTANTISTLFGKMARFSPLKRRRQLNHRFLCPNCLHFGGFDFACGECWAEIPDYADGKTQTCPRCQQSSLSADGDGVRAYCKQCKGNCDRAIYHQRQVRVLATLRPSDSASLYRAISGKEYQPQGGKGYVYDDGEWLAYVLNLSDFTDEAYSLPLAHALWEVESIWLDVLTSDPKELALEWGEAADRFVMQAKLTEAQRQAITVCVQQAEADPVVMPVLETRFGEVRYGVTVADLLFEGVQTKAVALREIDYNATVALIAALKESNSDVRREAIEALGKIGNDSAVPALIAAFINESACEGAVEALVKIGKPAVPALIAALKDNDANVRLWAAATLVKVGKSTVPALITALKGNVPVASVLINLGEEETLVKIGVPAVLVLIEAFKDNDANVYGEVVTALVKIGEPAIPMLIKARKDRDMSPGKQKGILETLIKIGKPAVPALIPEINNYLAGSGDPRWDESVAHALGEIGDASAVPALIQMFCFNKNAPLVAAEALVKIGKPATPALIKALNHIDWSDSNVHKRKAIEETLIKIGKPAVPALIEALKYWDNRLNLPAAHSLGEIGDASAVPALIAAIEGRDPDVRRMATEALGKIGDDSAVPALIAALKDRDKGLRWKAVQALEEIGDASAVSALIEALKDRDERVRWSATSALGKIGDASAVPALIAALKDSDASLHIGAAEALVKIGTPAVPSLKAADREAHIN